MSIENRGGQIPPPEQNRDQKFEQEKLQFKEGVYNAIVGKNRKTYEHWEQTEGRPILLKNDDTPEARQQKLDKLKTKAIIPGSPEAPYETRAAAAFYIDPSSNYGMTMDEVIANVNTSSPEAKEEFLRGELQQLIDQYRKGVENWKQGDFSNKEENVARAEKELQLLKDYQQKLFREQKWRIS